MPRKPVLVVGASGLVGGALFLELAQRGIAVLGTHRVNPGSHTIQLDMADRHDAARTVREISPTRVFIPAAMADVEACEAQPQQTWRTNVEDVLAFVKACDGLPVVYFSSEYAFDGLSGPYAESAPTNPLSQYGRQKVAVETYLQSRPRTTVVRTVHVFGPEVQEKNFISRLIRTLRAKQELPVANDQISTPTYNPQLARAVLTLALDGLEGIVHLVGADRMSRYDFARLAARIFELDENFIVPKSTAQLNQKAPRPLNAGLVSERVDYRVLGLTGIDEALRRAKQEML